MGKNDESPTKRHAHKNSLLEDMMPGNDSAEPTCFDFQADRMSMQSFI